VSLHVSLAIADIYDILVLTSLAMELGCVVLVVGPMLCSRQNQLSTFGWFASLGYLEIYVDTNFINPLCILCM
jgi:hypothetical protein